MVEDILILKVSRLKLAPFIIVCIILLIFGYVHIGGIFSYAASAFVILMVVFICLSVWFGSFTTVLDSNGIHGKSFYKKWSYSWPEIETWEKGYDWDGDFTVKFRVKGDPTQYFIQPLDSGDIEQKVTLYLTHYLGTPIDQKA